MDHEQILNLHDWIGLEHQNVNLHDWIGLEHQNVNLGDTNREQITMRSPELFSFYVGSLDLY
jgi:hypothetical protein